MRRSSIIVLAFCAVLLVYFITIAVSVHSLSHPEFTPADARDMLNRLGRAFEASNTEAVLSFAAPDAKVAGQRLDQIRKLLNTGFSNLKDQHVDFRNLQFQRQGQDTVILDFDPTVVGSEGGTGPSGVLFQHHMTFTVKRISEPRLGNLVQVYQWKITDVEAQGIPELS